MIPFNKPFMTPRSLTYIAEAHANGHLSGNGPFTKRCEKWLEKELRTPLALLTHSGTAALEMAAILADIGPGDEVIMPSFTFVSTANAFVLRGAVPVFVDIRPDTMSLDPGRIEAAVTPRTKAAVVVHYAGISAGMDAILTLAKKRSLLVIEDAAHGILSTDRGRPLGSMGHLAALSFHETKSIISGEGGALLVNDARFAERARIIREKGTDRERFLKGESAFYTWVDIGSSYLPSDLIAAFLLAQLEDAPSIIERRRALWERYHAAFEGLERRALARRPSVPAEVRHNGHMYHLMLRDQGQRDRFIRETAARGIMTVFHYIPLHESPAGKKFGRVSGSLEHTSAVSRQIVRLPLWAGLEDRIESVIAAVNEIVPAL